MTPLLAAALAACQPASAPEAISYGGGGCGRLEGGVAMPCSGENYEAFAVTACALGRTYLHPLVIDTVVAAYAALAQAHPDREWQYGDLGWEAGGELWPHKTHRSGVSADFFFPVDDTEGQPNQVPISLFNDFGYGIDFSKDGRFKHLRIDWTALVDHLEALEKAGSEQGVSIQRIFLAPALQKRLLRQVPRAASLQKYFNKHRAWVVHDEHYHVDFKLPRRLRRPLQCD